MSTFQDNQGREWTVKLDGPTIENIKTKHKINLVDLENDPLTKLANEPLVLVAVLYLLCESQIRSRELTPDDFGRCLVYPPDAMLEAIGEAIINFFPTGRASHVREVLKNFGEMSEIADKMATTKMMQMVADPTTRKRLQEFLDQKVTQRIQETLPLSSDRGTSSIVGMT